jgi:hypothetical protein
VSGAAACGALGGDSGGAVPRGLIALVVLATVAALMAGGQVLSPATAQSPVTLKTQARWPPSAAGLAPRPAPQLPCSPCFAFMRLTRSAYEDVWMILLNCVR